MRRSVLSSSIITVIVLGLVTVACGDEPSVEGDTADLTGKKGANKVTSCFGTEPFWDVTIDAKKVTYKPADGPKRTIENHGAKGPSNVDPAFASLYQGKTTEDANRFLNVIITDAGKNGCNPGMGEDNFRYSVSVLSGTDFLVGCCK